MPLLVRYYEFGRIVVDGREYTRDIIITPTRVIENWWRREGHRVCLDDLYKYGVFDEQFDIIVFGTGYYGLVVIEPEVIEELKRRGIEYIAQPTRDAVDTYNKLAREGRRVVGAFHLTC
ncbi:MAG: hypothetical protein GXO23_05335 [Crenarchaeota archaeon]|nr:hypothetical protein [Thermoproteota archaeon]